MGRDFVRYSIFQEGRFVNAIKSTREALHIGPAGAAGSAERITLCGEYFVGKKRKLSLFQNDPPALA
jgi:hypothetical protein